MYIKTKSVSPQDNYTVKLIFENQEEKILDLKPYLSFGVFSQLKDLTEFKTVRVAFGTIEWACGVDLDPEFVYSHSVFPL